MQSTIFYCNRDFGIKYTLESNTLSVFLSDNGIISFLLVSFCYVEVFDLGFKRMH